MSSAWWSCSHALTAQLQVSGILGFDFGHSLTLIYCVCAKDLGLSFDMREGLDLSWTTRGEQSILSLVKQWTTDPDLLTLT